MKVKRNMVEFIIFGLLTFGLYWLYVTVRCKTYLNSIGANIPSAILIIIPIANIYWLWKYCEAYNRYIDMDRSSSVLWFLLWILIPFVGIIVFQAGFNDYSDRGFTQENSGYDNRYYY